MVGAIVLVDAMFYGVVAPLLPYYAAHFRLDTAQAGVLTGAYGAGTLLVALPAGSLSARVGVRSTVGVGLGLMISASLGFAFARSIVLLDAARLVQGVGGGLSWTAGMAWLIESDDGTRRGQLIGSTIAAGVTGALLGPVLGTVALSAGPRAVFSFIAALDTALLAWALLAAAPPAAPRSSAAAIYPVVRDSRVVLGMWLIGLSAILTGTLTVLAPLRLSILGAARAEVGLAFLLGAGIQACASPTIGRMTDRYGWRRAVILGLAVSIVWLLAISASSAPMVLFVFVVLALGSFGFSYPSAGSMLSVRTSEWGLTQGWAFALFNFAWAGGQVLGNAGGAALAQETSDAVAYVVLATVCVVTMYRVTALTSKTDP